MTIVWSDARVTEAQRLLEQIESIAGWAVHDACQDLLQEIALVTGAHPVEDERRAIVELEVRVTGCTAPVDIGCLLADQIAANFPIDGIVLVAYGAHELKYKKDWS